MRSATSGAISDLICTAKISANKADVVKTLSAPTVQIPKIFIHCNVTFNDDVTKTAIFDIAPQFFFHENKVTNASLNIGTVEGIGFLGSIVKKQLSSEDANKSLAQAANAAITDILRE
jgi:hypothetical protein